MDRHLDCLGTDVLGITHRGSQRLPGFILDDLMRQTTTAFPGARRVPLQRTRVVKAGADGTDPGMKFAWHQDSGYVNFRDPGNAHRPCLTC